MIIRWMSVFAVVASLALAPATFAGECCKKAEAAAKAGKACEKCSKGCCKEAVAKLGKNEVAKSCSKCAKAKS